MYTTEMHAPAVVGFEDELWAILDSDGEVIALVVGKTDAMVLVNHLNRA